MFLDQPGSAQSTTGLLVSGEDQPERPPRRGTSKRPGRTTLSTIATKSFISTRTATPDTAVDHLSGERRHRPIVGIGRHHVEVAVHQQRRYGRSTPSGAQCATTDVRPGSGSNSSLAISTSSSNSATRSAATRSPGPGSGPKLEVSIRIDSLAQLDNLGLRPVVRAHWFIFAYACGRLPRPVEPFGVTPQVAIVRARPRGAAAGPGGGIGRRASLRC